MYLNGEGAPKNLVKAVRWVHKSADQDQQYAQACLAAFYIKGKGVPQGTSWGRPTRARRKEGRSRPTGLVLFLSGVHLDK